MKVIVTDGCTSYGCKVDGKDIDDLSIEEIKNVFKKVIDATMNEDTLRQRLMDFVETAGEYEFQYHCDQCGDDVYDYIMEV